MRGAAVAVAALLLLVANISPASATAPAPTYAGQIGGNGPGVEPGHATTYPGGVAVGPDGTIYVADTGNDQVEAIDGTSGAVLWRVGSRGVKPPGNFNNPRDIAYLNGLLYVDDEGDKQVQVLNASDGSPTATQWSYRFPSALGISAGFDSSGQSIILLTQETTNTIQIFTPSGALRCSITSPAFNAPRDAATNAAGDVYVANYAADNVLEFGPVSGTTCPTTYTTIGGPGTGPGQFKRPYGVDVGSTGNVFVADSANNRVEEFSPDNQYVATFGASAGSGGDLHDLRRVDVRNGQLYAADLWGFHIDRFPVTTPTATPAQTYPNGFQGPTTGYFNEPSGLTFDASGTLDVVDSVNQRIQPFAPGPDGATWTADAPWGTRGWGKADLSGFNWPRAITYAPASNTLWVADTKNERLLSFTTSDPPATGTAIGPKVTPPIHWPYGIAAHGSELIESNTFGSPASVEAWNANGTPAWAQPVTAPNGIPWTHPYGVAVANDVAYVADSGTKSIVELDAATGDYLGAFGTSNLHAPQGVAVDPLNGNVWVSDTGFNRLAEFTSSGAFIRTFGTKGSGNGQFLFPTSLAIHQDAGGHAWLYVCDTYNDRVEILNLNEN
jgi:tripartite motif-containing protein 71